MAMNGHFDPRRLWPVGRHGWLLRTPGFTAREVRQLLRDGGATARGRAVQRCAARPGDWLPAAPDLARCPWHYWERLPRIVHWYARGDTPERIGARVGGFGTPWGVEQALAAACAGMAACLNRDPRGYGYAQGRA